MPAYYLFLILILRSNSLVYLYIYRAEHEATQPTSMGVLTGSMELR